MPDDEPRRKLLGSLLAIPLLVFIILTAMGILVINISLSRKGMPANVGVAFFIMVLIMVSLALSWLYLRDMK